MLVLGCQSGVWSKAATFTGFATDVGSVDVACVSSGDPNPPYYDMLKYSITCGTRYCMSAGYFFGLIVEWSGTYDNNAALRFASDNRADCRLLEVMPIRRVA